MLVIGTTTGNKNCTVDAVPWKIPKYLITFVDLSPGLLGGGEGATKITLAPCPTCVSKLLDKVGLILSSGLRGYTWVKVFMIIPEFRILWLTFHRKWKVSLKMLNSAGNNSFSDLVSVNLKVINH